MKESGSGKRKSRTPYKYPVLLINSCRSGRIRTYVLLLPQGVGLGSALLHFENMSPSNELDDSSNSPRIIPNYMNYSPQPILQPSIGIVVVIKS